MPTPDERFKEIRNQIGHPDPTILPGLKFVPAVRAGKFLFLSGEGPRREGQFFYQGKVPDVVSVEDAVKAARLTACNLLFNAQHEVGSLNRVERVVEAFAMVNCSAGFAGHSLVANGLSSCLLEVFGERIGAHARAAVGMAELPFNICFEAKLTLLIAEC